MAFAKKLKNDIFLTIINLKIYNFLKNKYLKTTTFCVWNKISSAFDKTLVRMNVLSMCEKFFYQASIFGRILFRWRSIFVRKWIQEKICVFVWISFLFQKMKLFFETIKKIYYKISETIFNETKNFINKI